MATAVPAVACALLLLLSPPAHGDFDDDDGHCRPCRTPPPCCCPHAPAPTAPAPSSYPEYGCAEEYLGNSSGVYWHDLWKTCRLTMVCYGALLEGEPLDYEEDYFCPEYGPCPWNECVDIARQTRTSRTGKLQPHYALKDEKFEEKGHHPDLMDSDPDGFAEFTHDGQKYTFKLYAIVTRYPNERIKTRLIGVQLKPGELTKDDPPPRRAGWSKHEPQNGHPSTGSKVHHWIDVELKGADTSKAFPNGSTERFHVTTVEPATHEDQ